MARPLKGCHRADAKARCGTHDRREHHCGEGAHIQQKQHRPQLPRQVADHGQSESKCDVAAQITAPALGLIHL